MLFVKNCRLEEIMLYEARLRDEIRQMLFVKNIREIFIKFGKKGEWERSG